MSANRTAPRTAGVHHVGLTVADLDEAATFFREALAFEAIGGVPDYPAAFLSDGSVMLTLWQASAGADATPFDRKRNLGLHHLSLQVAGDDDLDALHRALAGRGDVEIEFPPEALGGGPTRHLMCTIPGGLRLELIAPAA